MTPLTLRSSSDGTQAVYNYTYTATKSGLLLFKIQMSADNLYANTFPQIVVTQNGDGIINEYMPQNSGNATRFTKFGFTYINTGDVLNFRCDTGRAESPWKTVSGIWTNI